MGHIETAETTGALSLLMITLGDAALCMVDMAWASRCALGSLSPGKISKRSQKCQASRKKKKNSVRGRELVLRPIGMACSLLEGEGHFILKFLGTMDGQNEVSIILEGKKSIQLHHSHPHIPHSLSVLGRLTCSFIHSTYI